MTPRSADGESTIYVDDRGTWHGQVSMGVKANGARDRRHVSGPTRAAVVAKVRDLERKHAAGTVEASAKSSTVAAWMEHWLDTIAVRRVRTSTLARYRGLVANQIVPGIGHHRLDRLAPEHIEKFYGALLAGGPRQRALAPATVRQVHRVLSRALKVAMQRGKVVRNVCTLVDAPSVVREEIEPFTADEAKQILLTARGGRNSARWCVALALGLRQGETLGLPWDGLDLDAGTLSVHQALQRQAGAGLVIVRPKSKAGTRKILLPTPMRDALRAHRKEQLAERLAAGSEWQDHGLVFTQPNGRPLDPRSDHRDWRALLANAGVRAARLHDARHTAATLLLAEGVDARIAMEILGHSQISMTAGYQHVSLELQQEAARLMGEALWGP